ncbi:peptidylprolyl isomerase [Pseudomonas huanghezhanensis]|uniref:peptidylprolyl isomerase n=1 Tax=Pseudomonas huanghezhanensis TaxID=3002903 RepID=UPI002285912F|nr:peptidylprolyl isomerase [Pseudomonas sp. BSw22131]
MNRSSMLFGGLTVLALAVGGAALCLQPASDSVAANQAVPAAKADNGDGPAVARLGDLAVTPAEVKALLASLPGASREQLLNNRAALENLIRTRLAEKAVLLQANAQGWPEHPDIQQQTRAATEQIVFRSYLASVSQVPDDYPSADELKQAYQTNQQALQLPARYRLSQIYLAVKDPGDEDAVRKQAQDLSKKAQAANADFAALARQYSQDSQSAARGGDIGLLPLAQLQPEVRGALGKLKEGSVSEPIKGPAGYHILKLVEQQPARVATLDEAKETLATSLRNQRQEQIAQAYLNGMFTTATLSIDGSSLNQVIKDNQ